MLKSAAQPPDRSTYHGATTMLTHPKTQKSAALIALCVVMGFIAFFFLNWSDWVKGWIGTHFKLLTGAVIGYLFSKYFLGIDPSEIEDATQRGFAGLSIAIVVGFFAHGAAAGL